jgi:hypothetical protein
MWKYIEGSTGKKKLTDDQVREHFGINEKKCPIVELDNGWIAAWCAEPLEKASAYPQLSHAPKVKTLGYASAKA